MIYAGWTIVFLLGLAVINAFSFGIKPLEKLGFSLPIGLGLGTLILMGFELVGLPLNNATLLLGTMAVLAIATGILGFIRNREHFTLIENIKNFAPKKLLPINLGWLVLIGCIATVVYTNVTKTLFWPVFIHDSVNGYDFLARVIFSEGVFNNSLFDPEYPLYSPRTLYPPLTPLSFNMAYLFGHGSPKIINAIFYVANATVFYSLIKRYSSHLAAALLTLLFLVTPEFAAFSALSSPNPICTFYSAAGILCSYIWYKENSSSYFNIGLICILLALWTRSETIMFVAGAGFLIGLKAIQTRKIGRLMLFAVPCAALFIFWQLYLTYGLKVETTDAMIDHLYWDYDKLVRLMTKVKAVTLSTQFYGLLVYLFLAMIAINAYFIVRYREGLVLLSAIIIPWLIYIAIYYQMEEDYLPGGTAYIEYGYKRGLFYFFPLFLFYCANNRISDTVFNKWLKL